MPGFVVSLKNDILFLLRKCILRKNPAGRMTFLKQVIPTAVFAIGSIFP